MLELKKILNYPNYRAGSDGFIYSLANKSRKKLKGSSIGSGYLKVTIPNKNREIKTCLVHRLILSSFKKNPDKKCCVNHLDRIKVNNQPSNLVWATHKENNDHSVSTNDTHSGEEHSMSKLTVEDVVNIIEMILDLKDNEEIGKKYNIHSRYVSLIRHRQRWKTLFKTFFPNYTPIFSNKKTVVKEHTKSEISLERQVDLIGLLDTKTNKELASMYCLDASVVSRIRSKKTWKLGHKIYKLNTQRLSKS